MPFHFIICILLFNHLNGNDTDEIKVIPQLLVILKYLERVTLQIRSFYFELLWSFMFFFKEFVIPYNWNNGENLICISYICTWNKVLNSFKKQLLKPTVTISSRNVFIYFVLFV